MKKHCEQKIGFIDVGFSQGLGGAVAALMLLGAQSNAQTGGGALVPPPTELLIADRVGTALQTSYWQIERADTSHNLLNRKVSIKWRRRFADGKLGLSTQEQGVNFWPTDVTELGVNRVAIAGQTIKGKTIIRVWELSSTEILPEASWNTTLQEWTYPATVIPIESAYNAYSGKEPGKKLGRVLLPNLGDSGKLFVLFQDSRDLYELSIDSGALSLVLSSTSTGGGEYQPDLSADYVNRVYGNHVDHGYIYVLRTLNNATLTPYFLIQDADRNGTIDPGASRTITPQEYESLGLSDPAKWN